MTAPASAHPSAPRRVYRLSPIRKWLLIGIWAMFAVPMAVYGLYANDGAAVVTAGVVTVIWLPLFGYIAWRHPRLALSPAGVELRHVGYKLATPWDNVAGIRLARGSEGFITRRPMEGDGSDRMARMANIHFGDAGVFLYGGDVRKLLTAKRFIPIEAFAYWLKHGDLRQEILRYAPWLGATMTPGYETAATAEGRRAP